MAAERNIDRELRGQRSSRLRALAGLARRQHGAVEHGQLVGLGFSADAVFRLLAAGVLQPVYRGVYAFGHSLSRHGRWMAAVLAAGPDALLSHRSSAALHRVRPPVDRIDVTAPVKRRDRPGLIIHRSEVPPDERTVVDGIPTTTILRTLLDLAATEDRLTTERAAHEAEARRLGDTLSPERFLARHARHRGSKVLATILQDRRLGQDLTESELEERFLAFLDAYGLPRPRLNVWLAGYRCDAVYDEARMVIELDSRRWHDTAARFDADRVRDRVLHVAGCRTVRVTGRDLREGRRALAADLPALARPA